MGSSRATDRRAGLMREGPLERTRIEVEQQRARERQRESWRRRRENARRRAEEESALVHPRLVRRDAATILSCVHRTLGGTGWFVHEGRPATRD